MTSTWLFLTFKGWWLSVGLRNQKIGATPNKSNKSIPSLHPSYPVPINSTYYNNKH